MIELSMQKRVGPLQKTSHAEYKKRESGELPFWFIQIA